MECLKDESPSSIREAFIEYFKEGKFFPKPAEILGIALRNKSARVRDYEPIDREETIRQQSTPEWEAAAERARRLLAKLAGRTFESVTNSREKLLEQAQKIQERRGKQQ